MSQLDGGTFVELPNISIDKFNPKNSRKEIPLMDRVIKKKKWPIQKILTYAGIPLVAIILLGLIVRNAGVKVYKTPKERLSIATVEKGIFQERIPIPGEVMPKRTVFIDAIEGGQVEAVYLEGGEMIKKGDLILKLSNPGLELQYMNITTGLLEQLNNLRNTRILLEETGLNLRAQLLTVENEIANFEQSYRRNKKLFLDSVVAEAEYIEIKNNYENSLKRKDLLMLRIEKDSILKAQQLGQVEQSMRLVEQNLELQFGAISTIWPLKLLFPGKFLPSEWR